MPALTLLRLAPYALLLVVLLGGWAAIETLRNRVQTAETQRDQAKRDFAASSKTNAIDQKSIDALRAALLAWQTTAQNAQDAQKAAEAELTQAAAQAAKMSLQIKQQEHRDVGNAACEKLLGTSVSGVCPGHIDALRLRIAHSDLQGQSR